MAPSSSENPEGRNISEAEVEATVEDPDIRYNDPVGKPTYVRHIGGRRIKVVVRPGSDPPYVITAAAD